MSERSTCIVATAVLCMWAAACQAQPEPRELPLAGGNLEGEWRFSTDPTQAGEKGGWARPDFDDSAWKLLKVPGFWEDQGVTETYEGMPSPQMDPAVSKLNAYNGVAWYRLAFRVPTEWRGVDLVLRMGSVDDVDTTFVNGQKVGSTGEGAENPSTMAREYDVPARLVDAEGVNTLAIRVVDHGGPGGIPQGPVSLLPVDYLERLIETMKPTGAELRERFATPPADRRILKIVHGLPADPAQHETFFTTLLEQGFGGVVCNVSFSQYLQSDELWDSFVHGARLAHGLGMAMWLYDEEGYPSGNAGGLVLKEHPEWQAKGLHIAEAETDGAAVELAVPPGAVRLAVACPVEAGQVDAKEAADVSDAIADGTLRWTPPEGEWHVFVFVENVLHEGTHAVSNVHRAQPYINIMDSRPVKRFIELTHEEYVKRLPELKDLFVATFTDEPSLMSGFMKEQPWAAVPWADDFADTFRAAKGYDLMPWLPALMADAGPDGHRARCDYWDHVAQRTADAFFGQIQDWCHRESLPSGGHLLWEESIANHCIFYGDFYRCAERLDYPGIDCLTSAPANVPWLIGKLLSSVAHLHGAPVVMSETSDFAQFYRPAGNTTPIQPVGVPDILGTCNRLYVAGVNTTTSYYSWRDLDTTQMRHINEFVGRCGTMLTGGKPISDVAVLYPIESVWAHMTPATQGATRSPEVHRIDRLWQECQNLLFRNQRDFEVIPSHAIASARVEDGALVAGPLRFRAVVLTATDTISAEAWERLSEFWDQGGMVVLVGDVPANSTQDLRDARVGAASARMLGLTDRDDAGEAAEIIANSNAAGGVAIYVPETLLPAVPRLLDRLLARDFAAGEASSALRYAHWQIDGREAYYVINDSASAVQARCTFAAEGDAELWDPATGQITPIGAAEADGGSTVPIALEPYGAVFVVFPRAVERSRREMDEPLGPVASTAPLSEVVGAEVRFEAGGAEHVTRSTTPAPAGMGGDRPGTVLIDATIRKGGIDSHCFANAQLPAGTDLRGYEALRIRTYVPEGQGSCGTSLLAMLHEKGGAVYIASVGRALSEPGWQESLIWLESFDLAGWTKDDNNRLDLDEISAISVGWGGYFGKDDEQVRFALAPVELVRFEWEG